MLPTQKRALTRRINVAQILERFRLAESVLSELPSLPSVGVSHAAAYGEAHDSNTRRAAPSLNSSETWRRTRPHFPPPAYGGSELAERWTRTTPRRCRRFSTIELTKRGCTSNRPFSS